MPTTAEIVDLYPIAQYLATIDLPKQGLYDGGTNLYLPQKIRNIGNAIEWVYDRDPSYDGLTETANFLWTLCGIYGQQALQVQQTPGYVPSPTPSGGSLPEPIDYEIGASTTPLANGESSVTLTDFIGYNLVFNRNNIPQSTVNQGGSYYSWDRTTGAFVCFPAAVTTELFQIIPIG